MWESLVPRVVKASVMGVVMLASVFFMSRKLDVAVIAALLPAVLGMLNTLAGLAYGVTGLTFLAAVAFALVPRIGIDVNPLIEAVMEPLPQYHNSSLASSSSDDPSAPLSGHQPSAAQSR